MEKVEPVVASETSGAVGTDDKNTLTTGEVPPELASPLRVVVPERRLSGNTSNHQQGPPASPHHRRRKSAGAKLDVGGSSISNLEELIDPDILTDKMGLVELERHQSGLHVNGSFSNLAPVTERMSEETLEDVHAFTDIVRGSRPSINVGGEVPSSVLESLDEAEDD